MDSTPVIFDISSDEEPAWEEPKGEDYSWLSEVLEAVNEELGDPDEVVVVGEVNIPKQKRSKSSKTTVKDVAVFDDDDDCVVLDGDPDKTVAVVNETTDESDELLIIGQKGQIACRDYPHPRHLCAKFPFTSTPHERHCDLCHCYVCDSLAPCVYWSIGISSIDHCHANEKEGIWKTRRENVRLGKNSLLPVSKFPDTSLSVTPPQLNQAPASGIIQLAPNSVPQNQVSRPTTIRACSSSTRVGIPNIIGQSRSRHSGSILNKIRVQPRLVSSQLFGVRNNVLRKDRSLSIGNRGPQLVSSNTMSKRAGVVGGASSGYGSSNQNNVARASQYTQIPAQLATSNDKNPTGWQDVCSRTNLETYLPQSSSQPNMDSVFSTTVPSEPQVYGQPIPLSNVSENMNQFSSSQNQTTAHQGFTDFGFGMANNSSQIYQQLPVENFQPQNTASTNDPLFDFEDWLLENHSVPVIPDGFLPEPATFDAGMFLFDLETSLNHLTHA